MYIYVIVVLMIVTTYWTIYFMYHIWHSYLCYYVCILCIYVPNRNEHRILTEIVYTWKCYPKVFCKWTFKTSIFDKLSYLFCYSASSNSNCEKQFWCWKRFLITHFKSVCYSIFMKKNSLIFHFILKIITFKTFHHLLHFFFFIKNGNLKTTKLEVVFLILFL